MATIYEKMTAIGNAIRSKTGGTELLTLDDMASEIAGMSVVIEKTPILNDAYPQDVSVYVGDEATFQIIIAEHGKPAEYTYQWYYDGSAIEGATGTSYSRVAEVGEHTVYCMVTNKAGAVNSRIAILSADTLYLYNLGNICEDVTGGWEKFGSATIENTSDGLLITVPASWKSGGAQTVNLIDVTNYNVIECESTSNTDDFLLCVNKDGTDIAQGTGNVSISTVTGMCRIRFYSSDSGSSADIITVKYLRMKK